MFHRLKNMSVQAKAAIVFTLATFVCKGINFITLPIFTRLMSTEQMGIVTTYNSWQVLLVVFANLSLDSGSFNIAMMEYKEDRYKYMSSILTLSTLSSLILAGLYFIFKAPLSKLVGLDDSLMGMMLISFIFLPATSFWMLHQRYTYKYRSTAVVTILSNGLSVLISVIAVYLGKKSGSENLADIRLVSSNIVLIACGAFFYFYIFFRGKTGYNSKYWKFVLFVNTPLLFHSLAKHILDVSDRTMISNMVGKSEVGIYGVLYSVSALALIVWNAINSSLIPYMFESIEKHNTQKLSELIEIMLLIYSIACICLTLAAPEIVKVLATSEYLEAVYLMPPIAAGIFFTSLYNIYSNLLLYYKKTNYIMIATAVAAIFNIITNYIFIKMIGYQAAAYTTLCSYIILAYMQYRFVKKIVGGDTIFNDKHLWLIAVLTATICLLINFTYSWIIIRYCLVAVVFIMCTVYRKRIVEMINRMRHAK